MKHIYFVVFVMLFHTFGLSQDYDKVYKAEEAMGKHKYEKAINLFKKASYDDPNNAYIQYKIGKCYYLLNDYNQALPYFESAKPYMKDSMKFNFDLYHLYSLSGYDNLAKEAYIGYISNCKTCDKEDLLPSSSSNRLIYAKPEPRVELMGYESKRAEYYPYIISDDQIQHLNAKIDRSLKADATEVENYMTDRYSNTDMMFYNKHNYKQYNKVKGLDYGPFSLNDSLNRIYITRRDVKNNRLYIYYSERSNNEEDKMDKKWICYRPIKISTDGEGMYDYMHPMLSADETQLFFVSNMPGGMGGYDIWYGTLDDKDVLTDIRNAGNLINTPGDEMYPTVYDENTMFFASNGHYGLGSLDQYVAVYYNGGFRKTYNLGKGFNTPYDDYALFFNKKKNEAYFTSNRFMNSNYQMPFDRIYKTKFRNTKLDIEVMDRNTKSYIPNAKVSLPSNKVEQVTDNSKLSINLNPLGFKKMVVQADNYLPSDTFLNPFANKVTIYMDKKAPKDYVSFNLVSLPSNKGIPNTQYVLTSMSDGKEYSGVTDFNGMGHNTLYGEESYTINVPKYNFSQKDISFANKLEIKTIPITSDKNAGITQVVRPTTPVIKSNLDGNFVIYHNSDGVTYANDVTPDIKALADILAKNPTYKASVVSHTDCQGESGYNMGLSKRRNQQVLRMLQSRGIKASQLVGKFVGEADPANDCKCDPNDNYNCDSDKFKMNRRTVVSLIK